MPETYDGYVWSHWLQDGDSDSAKTVVMDTDKPVITAYDIGLSILVIASAASTIVYIKRKRSKKNNI